MADDAPQLSSARLFPAPRRVRLLLLTVLGVFLTLLAGAPALADPGTDDEGGTQAMREQLETAARSYYDAKALLEQSEARQAQLVEQLQTSEAALARLTAEVGSVASARYKGAQIGVFTGLLNGDGNPGAVLQGAALADYLVWRDDTYLRLYSTTKDTAAKQRQDLDAEVANASQQLAALDQSKRDAEKALASVGGLVSPGYTGPSAAAQAAPRNADGTFPREGCTVTDPTGTGGCVSPRMYHALTEARLAGFNHYVSCWRSGDWGEHPIGMACDFAADPGGFGGAATGDSKDYGSRLAAWCVANAAALGVRYVIWFRQIWFPGTGWGSYNSYGDPATEHTNHVHLSMI